MKTPLEELIEWIDKVKNYPDTNIQDVRTGAVRHIEKEKQAIIEAFKAGKERINNPRIAMHPDFKFRYESAEQYYNETYKDPLTKGGL